MTWVMLAWSLFRKVSATTLVNGESAFYGRTWYIHHKCPWSCFSLGHMWGRHRACWGERWRSAVCCPSRAAGLAVREPDHTPWGSSSDLENKQIYAHIDISCHGVWHAVMDHSSNQISDQMQLSSSPWSIVKRVLVLSFSFLSLRGTFLLRRFSAWSLPWPDTFLLATISSSERRMVFRSLDASAEGQMI